MAIAYNSTSVSDADAPSAGILAQIAVREALLGHPSGAWTLEEEFDSSGGTIHWVVLKNDGSDSGVGFDFYVVISRLVATGQIGIFVGEVYTAGTNSLSTFAPRSGEYYSNSILADFSYSTDGGTPASFTLGTSFPGGDNQPYCPVPTAAPTMRFISIVEKDYAIFVISNLVVYVGALIDDIVPGVGIDAAVPVGCFNLPDGGVPGFGSLTRHPIDPAAAPMAVSRPHALMPLPFGPVMAERQALTTAVYLHGDRMQGGRVSASEISAVMAAGSVGGNANNGGEKTGVLRGRFKNIRYTSFPIAAAVFDTIVVDGRKHVVVIDHNQMDNGFVQPQNHYDNIRRGLVCDTGQVAV